MFSNPSKIDSSLDEGTVSEVDPIRFFCKVKTIRGQNLDQVQWLQNSGGSSRAGDRATPVMGDRVAIHHGLGYPLIIGYLPKVQTADNTFPVHIDTGAAAVDTGNFSPQGVNALGDQNKPGDMAVGDRVIASTGGGILAVLRGGSILLRSSKLSEVFISKWDDLVRIVGRNFEQFSDVHSDVIKNIKGRVYRYVGYANTDANARIESYLYNLYYGDTTLAEAVKTNYQGSTASPAASAVIFKEEVPSLMTRTVDGGSGAVIQIVGSGITTTVTQNGTSIVLDYNGQQTVTIDASTIDLKHSSGAESLYNSEGISHTFKGHFVKVTSGGVQMG